MPVYIGGGSLVNSSSIINNSILNEDINAAAAIAITKLAGVAASGDNTDITGLTFLKTAEINISAAEIKALGATPKELIAAPGAGKIIVPEDIVFSLTAGTNYGNGGGCNVSYNGDGMTAYQLFEQLPTTFFTAGSSEIHRPKMLTQLYAAAMKNGINKNVTIKNVGAEYITGTGTCKVFIKYRVITL